jgi:3-methyladenine DNA glycosylase AlkD
MNVKQVLDELKGLGSEQIRKIFLKHGVEEPLYGVKIEELKKFQKKIKKDHGLSLGLFDSGIADAQYLAGLIADENKITPDDLRHWAANARGAMVREYTVPWVASESPHGWELALEWIASKDEDLQVAGWSTLSNVISLRPDTELDLKKIKSLLQVVKRDIHKALNRVRYVMNGFVISAGTYISSLTDECQAIGKAIGKVSVEMNGTACKVPYSPEYIQKSIDRGSIGKKKKMARC